jgi:hypothetical protein
MSHPTTRTTNRELLSSRRGRGRRITFVLAAASGILLLSAGTSYAASGNGNIGAGYEIPSERVTLSGGGVQCATFHRINGNNQSDPTIHKLPMTGNFGLVSKTGGGTATFTITNDWYAGPGGTYTSNTCATLGSVPGTLSVSYVGWTCASGSATYSRVGTTYSLTGTVVCDNTSTGTVETTPITVTFTGSQTLCGGAGQPICNNVNAGTNISGTYSWSTP